MRSPTPPTSPATGRTSTARAEAPAAVPCACGAVLRDGAALPPRRLRRGLPQRKMRNTRASAAGVSVFGPRSGCLFFVPPAAQRVPFPALEAPHIPTPPHSGIPRRGRTASAHPCRCADNRRGRPHAGGRIKTKGSGHSGDLVFPRGAPRVPFPPFERPRTPASRAAGSRKVDTLIIGGGIPPPSLRGRPVSHDRRARGGRREKISFQRAPGPRPGAPSFPAKNRSGPQKRPRSPPPPGGFPPPRRGPFSPRVRLFPRPRFPRPGGTPRAAGA